MSRKSAWEGSCDFPDSTSSTRSRSLPKAPPQSIPVATCPVDVARPPPRPESKNSEVATF
eukprot:scaffold9208_cov154-Amphora_coffeaeformis.AAC.3